MQLKQVALFVFVLLLMACGQAETVPTAVPAPTNPTSTAAPQPTDAVAAVVAEGETAVSPQPIQISYTTPAQQEGPYYPVEKPSDRDNDLTSVAGASGPPAGDILHLSGVVYDANGWPIEGLIVEIWQTDNSGIYLHPGDGNTDQRDRNFQFYGEAITNADGLYSFRTIVPGLYEPRPRHIHVKVKQNGQELITTQFYFANEANEDPALLINPAPAADDNGNPILVGQRDIVLSIPLR